MPDDDKKDPKSLHILNRTIVPPTTMPRRKIDKIQTNFISQCTSRIELRPDARPRVSGTHLVPRLYMFYNYPRLHAIKWLNRRTIFKDISTVGCVRGR